MKQLDLPFKIDKPHEDWQFELDAIEDRLNGYHSYKYIGEKFNYFLNFSTDETELIFNADFLTAVIITIKEANRNQFSAINQFLVLYASKETIIDEYTRKYKIWRVTYYTFFQVGENKILIIYGKPRFLKNHLIILL